MEVTNSSRFISAFNRIEHALNDIIGAKEYVSFTRLIEQAKSKNAVVHKYEDDLRSYAELRNAIVHNQIIPEFIIAEPHLEVVERIENIDAQLINPKTVGQLFNTGAITFQIDDLLPTVLEKVRDHKYTQYPVYEKDRFKGMVTTTGITYWLALTWQSGQFPTTMPTVEEILLHEKNATYYQFIRTNRTVYEAEQIFKSGIEHGHQYQALLITETGQPHEPLIGIITPIDVMSNG